MDGNNLDIAGNRKAFKYSSMILFLRILWGGARLFFHYSPRPFFGWRNILLRIFGARIGKQVHIYNSAVIVMPWNLEIGDWSAIGENVTIYNLGKITIGSKATISHGAHLCAGSHDYEDPVLPLLKQPIQIEDQVWICADAFVGPGVKVGEGAVVGARSVAMKDVEPWMVVAGNPARNIKQRRIRTGNSE